MKNSISFILINKIISNNILFVVLSLLFLILITSPTLSQSTNLIDLRSEITKANVYGGNGLNWTNVVEQYIQSPYNSGWAEPNNGYGRFEQASHTSGGVQKDCIDAAPASNTMNLATVAEYEIYSPSYMSGSFAIKDGGVYQYASVEFLIQIKDGSNYTTLLDSSLTYNDPGWRSFHIDLTPWQNKTVTLRLITNSGDTPYEDWADWAEVVVAPTTNLIDLRSEITKANVYGGNGLNWTNVVEQYIQSPYNSGWAEPNNGYGRFEQASHTSGGVQKDCIDAAPASNTMNLATVAEYEIYSPSYMSGSFAIKDGGVYQYASVEFLIQIKDGSNYTTLLDSSLTYNDPGWRSFHIDLTPWQNKTVTLRLITNSGDTPYEDWADWAEVVVAAELVTGIENNSYSHLPKGFILYQNFPNPFNPSTNLSYSTKQSGLVTLKVYDVLGNEIETLVNEEKPVGSYELNWNAANLPSGVYFFRLQAGSYVQTRKMILLK